jgi:hypothetical protein
VLCWHLAGNFRSRFTDFLTSDGEKPWRRREEEFSRRAVTKDELLAYWEGGWAGPAGRRSAGSPMPTWTVRWPSGGSRSE